MMVLISTNRSQLTIKWTVCTLSLLVMLGSPACAGAQDNYEIQVYSYDTVAPRTTMIELHSNFTVQGRTTVVDGLAPTNHAVHETIEITQGFTDWFETGFYIFTSIQPDGGGWQWVGDHIRPRVRVPESWHWPVGVSLSQEIGYQRRQFSVDAWTWEIRPIVDKKLGRWYLSFNPSLERSWHGESVNKGVEFSPSAKVSYDFTKHIAGGLEYYGAAGPLSGFDTLSNQEHQFFPTIDLDVSPEWEINFGVGLGVTRSTDHLIIKGILGRRFSWPHRRAKPALLNLATKPST